jgi:two-component system, NarL family, invasion response regulator UvrY
MIRILIVDDHPIVRKGLRASLAEFSEMQIVGEAQDGAEALTKARTTIPDVILLDISMPGKSGLEVLRQLRAERPAVKVLVLSTYPEKQYAVRCFKNGAVGYLAKESASEELVTAIRRVAVGRKYVSSSLAELLASEVQTDVPGMPHEALSDREFEVLCLLGRGKTVSQIAEMLSLSLPTINTYRSRILQKMRMESTAQLVHYVLENKLVDKVD